MVHVLLLLTASAGLMGAAGDQTGGYPALEAPAPGYPGPGPSALGYYDPDPDYALQAGDTDRISEEFLTLPFILTGFFSALMGGLLAPLVVGVAARMGELELPDIPQISGLNVPDIPIKRIQKNKTKKGRVLEDSIVSLLTKGFQHLSKD